jgi:hypothetical protein
MQIYLVAALILTFCSCCLGQATISVKTEKKIKQKTVITNIPQNANCILPKFDNVEIDAPDEIKKGDLLTVASFRTSITPNSKLRYFWKISDGIILKQKSNLAIEIDTRKVKSKFIIATLIVEISIPKRPVERLVRTTKTKIY